MIALGTTTTSMGTTWPVSIPLRRSCPAKMKVPTMTPRAMISEYQRSAKAPMWPITGSMLMVM